MIFRFFLVSLLLAFSFAAQASKGKGKKGISCNEVKKTPMTDEGDESLLRKFGIKKEGEPEPQRARTNSRRRKIKDVEVDGVELPSDIRFGSNSYVDGVKNYVPPGGHVHLERFKNLAKRAGRDPEAKRELDRSIASLSTFDERRNYARHALSQFTGSQDRALFRSPDQLQKAMKDALSKGKSRVVSDKSFESRFGTRKYEVTVGAGKKRSVYEMEVCVQEGCARSRKAKLNQVVKFKPKCGPGILKLPSRNTFSKAMSQPTVLVESISTNSLCP